MSNLPTPGRERLLVPALAGVYARLGDLAELVLRVVSGLALVTHGYPKIQEPLARIDMVESLGFYPGVFWSPMLALTEFFGGFLIALGLFTRPAAAGAFIVLTVAAYSHWVPREEGYAGAETAILWAAIMLFFALRGGNHYSVDARLPKEL